MFSNIRVRYLLPFTVTYAIHLPISHSHYRFAGYYPCLIQKASDPYQWLNAVMIFNDGQVTTLRVRRKCLAEESESGNTRGVPNPYSDNLGLLKDSDWIFGGYKCSGRAVVYEGGDDFPSPLSSLATIKPIHDGVGYEVLSLLPSGVMRLMGIRSLWASTWTLLFIGISLDQISIGHSGERAFVEYISIGLEQAQNTNEAHHYMTLPRNTL
jgi:hypothetical protein